MGSSGFALLRSLNNKGFKVLLRVSPISSGFVGSDPHRTASSVYEGSRRPMQIQDPVGSRALALTPCSSQVRSCPSLSLGPTASRVLGSLSLSHTPRSSWQPRLLCTRTNEISEVEATGHSRWDPEGRGLQRPFLIRVDPGGCLGWCITPEGPCR